MNPLSCVVEEGQNRIDSNSGRKPAYAAVVLLRILQKQALTIGWERLLLFNGTGKNFFLEVQIKSSKKEKKISFDSIRLSRRKTNPPVFRWFVLPMIQLLSMLTDQFIQWMRNLA